MEDVDREISEMKLSLNARARIVAESYLTAVSGLYPYCNLPRAMLTVFISLIRDLIGQAPNVQYTGLCRTCYTISLFGRSRNERAACPSSAT